MKEDNGNGQIDHKKLDEEKEPKELDITAELIKLYQHDPISHSVIKYMLSKYKIIPVNAMENIRLHQEELLLNIVLIYKKMWAARGSMIAETMQTGGKPVRIVIKEKGKDESKFGRGETKSSEEDGKAKRSDID